MQVIIAGIVVFGAVGTIIFLSFQDMNSAVKAAFAAMVVFIAVYALARIPPKQITSEKDTVK